MKKLLLFGAVLASLLGSNVSASAAGFHSAHTTTGTHVETTPRSYDHETTRQSTEPNDNTENDETTIPKNDTDMVASHSRYEHRNVNADHDTSLRAAHPWRWFFFGWLIGHHNHHHADNRQNTAHTNAATPSKALAESVLTPSIKAQLKTNNIKYNGSGAFIIDHNKTNLNADVTSAPYATNTLDNQKRAYDGEALLNQTTRQYQNREATNNGASNWKPAGFVQRTNLNGLYRHAYDRGHLLGYALVGGLKGFDASESNPKNIATQTAWSNEARDQYSTGQNYYEGLVRKALDQNKTVRYSVKDLYESKPAKVPAGAWIQAKSTDGAVNFNVFVPNVQSGMKINYNTGATTIDN